MADMDLAAYLDRIGVPAEAPSRAALTRLLQAHVRTFPFDNIDVLLEQHPGVSLAAVAEKFVGRGRGGYCFEHATLFGAVLEELGYAVSARLSRVGDPATAARTHLDLVVELDGERLLVDPGIGMPPLEPIPMVDQQLLPGPFWPHRLVRVAEGEAGAAWQLWRERSTGWELMHTTDELPVRPVDVAMGHLWTSTAPDSHFRSSFTLARHGLDPDGTPTQTTVSLDGVTERRGGEPSRRRPLDLAELPALLHRLGAHLNDEETDRLLTRVQELLARTG